MLRRVQCLLLVLLAALAACERPAPTANRPESDDRAAGPALNTPSGQRLPERAAMDRLARRLARALASPEFRRYLKAELDRSPVREHKLQLQSFLRTSDGHALREVARLNAVSESTLQAESDSTIPLEVYLPVPRHRLEWTGGANILVASAREDREAPVAYDVAGHRQVLSPDTPPDTPVLSIVPVETDFATREVGRMECLTCGGGGDGGGGGGSTGGGTATPLGLWLTYAHFVQDFEGWFKGSPEFEIHILGQSGATDSLKDYQCSGGAAGGYYHFDQNQLDWSGSVLLFTQAQLNGYKTAHPSQNFRILALEDDDTGCVIKFDQGRFKNLITTLNNNYPNLTGAKDTANTLIKWVRRANALQKILAAAYGFITTQDDMIGTAIEDIVVGQKYPGANWIVKGEGNVTNGWIKLEMR